MQGVAAGLLISTMSAAVVDLEPATRPGLAATFNSVIPLSGLAVGALAAAPSSTAARRPADRVRDAHRGLPRAGRGASSLLPETSPRHEGWRRSLRPRVGIPAAARPAFRRSAPALFAGWATGGLYLSLGAPIVGQCSAVAATSSRALVVTVLTGVGALSSYLGRRRTPRQITLYGTTMLARRHRC